MKNIRWTYEDWLLACFLLGTIGGTAAACFFGFGQENTWQLASIGVGMGVYLEVLRLRLSQLFLGWIVGMSICAVPIFGILFFFGGMGLGAAVCGCTFLNGIWGILATLCRLGLHWAVYGFVWLCLASWGGQKTKRPRLIFVAFLALLVGAGAFLETWISPLIFYTLFS